MQRLTRASASWALPRENGRLSTSAAPVNFSNSAITASILLSITMPQTTGCLSSSERVQQQDHETLKGSSLPHRSPRTRDSAHTSTDRNVPINIVLQLPSSSTPMTIVCVLLQTWHGMDAAMTPDTLRTIKSDDARTSCANCAMQTLPTAQCSLEKATCLPFPLERAATLQLLVVVVLLSVFADRVQPRRRLARRRVCDRSRNAHERPSGERELLGTTGCNTTRRSAAAVCVQYHRHELMQTLTSRISWAISSSAGSDRNEQSCWWALTLSICTYGNDGEGTRTDRRWGSRAGRVVGCGPS